MTCSSCKHILQHPPFNQSLQPQGCQQFNLSLPVHSSAKISPPNPSLSSSPSSSSSFAMVSCTPLSEDEKGGLKLNLVYFSNEFPSDDLSSLFTRLRESSKRHDHPVLGRFLDAATQALRQETGRLHTELSHLVPAFESVTSLAGELELRKGPLCGSIDGILLCVLQLATYIGYDLGSTDSSLPTKLTWQQLLRKLSRSTY